MTNEPAAAAMNAADMSAHNYLIPQQLMMLQQQQQQQQLIM